MSNSQSKNDMDLIMEYAEMIAESQIKKAECNMFRNLYQHPQCLNALRTIGRARKSLQLDMKEDPLIKQLVSGYVEYAVVLSMLAYLTGVQDGAKLHQDFLSGNLPQI